ncbi:hypothetical protein [Streptomyces sp. TRM68367]|uniref:hypothetical protein n=1 Tax=Streptomyces sp. TRM68367 TaxID=2758415 RepID=UPI00165B75EA|nr:hypothetical protein [Streptomyces sp. TRM68367]MBC9729321.1 hypothetical protein [Streptomyces sp. TRM68367]
MGTEPAEPEPMADNAYQPTGSNEEQEDAAPLDPQDTVDEPTYDETLDQGYSPPERPLGVTRHGTTAAEQRDGETLDERLAQERPDVPGPAGEGEGEGESGTGAEEAAVQVVGDDTEPPGAQRSR